MRRTQCQGEGRGGRTPRARGRSSSACFGLLTGAGVDGGAAETALAQPPGPEIFARDPKTPLELWDAVDYLVRTEQAPRPPRT
ncbi:MAG: hypothetical protein U0835_13205 [Isosphaeraceae bacterium]